jgi:hypothetical protein
MILRPASAHKTSQHASYRHLSNVASVCELVLVFARSTCNGSIWRPASRLVSCHRRRCWYVAYVGLWLGAVVQDRIIQYRRTVCRAMLLCSFPRGQNPD